MTMTRNDLILEHEGLVKSVAMKMVPPSNPEFDDLVQDGFIGLMEALERYDPARGKFATFAWHCVHSRMQDGARLRFGVNSGYRQYLKKAREKGQVPPEVTHVPIQHWDAAYTTYDHDRTLDVNKALKALTPRERRLLRRIYWDGARRVSQPDMKDRAGSRTLTKQGVSHVHRTALRRLSQGPLSAYRRAA